ncbi:MAG TPA: RluA family pseudouridine synthase [Veillonellaceae bacterium]|nr:RluA family pseudouridine synthase [Veillonellaceae bacterium]
MDLKVVVDPWFEGKELRHFVLGHMHLSSSLWKKIKWNGTILINGRQVFNARTALHAGDEITLIWSEENDILPVDIPLDIVYEDPWLLVVNKGPHMIIHPTSKSTQETLVNAVAGYFKKKGEDAGIHPVYRLDRNTTGLVVVAKSANVQYDLSKSHDSIYREYLALVSGEIEMEEKDKDKKVIDDPIGRKPGSIVEWMVRDDGKPAWTEYMVVAHSWKATLVRVHLLTGRTHQIRVHFSHMHHPLLGDDLYGGSMDLIQRQALHAYSVEFTHPVTGKKMNFTAPVPDDMKSLIKDIWPDLDISKL